MIITRGKRLIECVPRHLETVEIQFSNSSVYVSRERSIVLYVGIYRNGCVFVRFAEQISNKFRKYDKAYLYILSCRRVNICVSSAARER